MRRRSISRRRKHYEKNSSTYPYCSYHLVCCYGRGALGQRACESERTNQVNLCLRATLPNRSRIAAGPLAFVQGLFEAPWRGFDTGIFGQGFGPRSFALGDLDGDGDVDILVGDSFFGSPGVSVLKNNGDQTFAAPVYYSAPLNEVVGEVALSDFDSDGDLDAFATIRGDFDQMTKIKVWRNNGDGTFAAPIEFTTGQGPAGIVIADFTGDGKPDVVTANYGGSSISILRHNGLTGDSAGFLPPVNFSTANHAEKIAAADVNGDGILDVVVGGQVGIGFDATLAVMINTGNGVFAAPVPVRCGSWRAFRFDRSGAGRSR